MNYSCSDPYLRTHTNKFRPIFSADEHPCQRHPPTVNNLEQSNYTPPLNDPAAPMALAMQLSQCALSINYVVDFFGEDRARRLISEADISSACRPLPSTITKAEFWTLCLNNINQTNDEGHGLTRQPLPKSTWGTIFSSVNQMETLGDGLQRLTELVQIVPSGITATLGYGSKGIHLNIFFSDYSTQADARERYVESFALQLHCALLWMTDASIRPVQVRSSTTLKEDDGSLLSGLTNEHTRRGIGATLVYRREDMSIPLGARKYRAWAVHETTAFHGIIAQMPDAGLANRSPTVEKIFRLLTTEDISQKQAAKMVGMSVATLQRRLSEAGTTFREISKDVRRSKLIALLATDSNLDDVAEELGLSDRRSLWRACFEWLGASPTQYRNTHRTRELSIA